MESSLLKVMTDRHFSIHLKDDCFHLERKQHFPQERLGRLTVDKTTVPDEADIKRAWKPIAKVFLPELRRPWREHKVRNNRKGGATL